MSGAKVAQKSAPSELSTSGTCSRRPTDPITQAKPEFEALGPGFPETQTEF